MPLLRFTTLSAALLSAALLPACGSNTTELPGYGGGGTGGGTTSTGHPRLPRVVNLGGPVLPAPKVQPIAYSDDASLTDVEAFLQELTKTTYWSETTSQYGVGPLTVLPTIVQPGTAPATLSDDQIKADLASYTTGASPAWGAASAITIYLILAPEQTAVSMDYAGIVSHGCKDFDGYHDEAMVSSTFYVPYAVSCACPGYDGPMVTDVQERTVNISHELIESATDPFSNTDPAWVQEDNPDLVWSITLGGEVADMCELNRDSLVIPPGGTYMVQRSWSNKAAAASTNPCVPVPGTGPYFNSYPVLPDMENLVVNGLPNGPLIPGVTIPVGGSKTIDVDLFSDAPTSGPWTVKVYDGESMFAMTPSPYLQLTLDQDTGQNGSTLHLTIKVLKADTTNFNGVEPFLISSDLNGQENLWMGVVGQ